MNENPTNTEVGIAERIRRFFLIGRDQQRNAAMEGLRGYAALLVVFIHTTGSFFIFYQHFFVGQVYYQSVTQISSRFPPATTLTICLARAYYAVDLFFLLSGFLIMRILLSARQRGTFSYRSYLAKRCLRIYPTFLCALLFCLVVHVGYLGEIRLRLGDLLGNLVFLNGFTHFPWKIPGYVASSWSLFYEFSFYLTMPCAFLAGQWIDRKGVLGKFL